MNRDELKQILLLYRPGTADAQDPEIAAALAAAQGDAELAHWLESHVARQRQLAQSFTSISVPAGLKEQILSEHAADQRRARSRPVKVYALVLAIICFVGLALYQMRLHARDNPLALFRNQMTGFALHGYGMELTTNNPTVIREFLHRRKCPADYSMPASLKSVEVVGCAAQRWQDKNVSMICLRTGKPLAPGQASDLWFFVAQRSTVKDAPEPGQAKVFRDGPVTSAIWTEGETVYLLATEGDADALQKFL